MRLEIEHLTSYRYSEAIFLDPHHLYFHPALRNHITFKKFEIKVNPQYDGLTQRVDAENNVYHQVWFSDAHSSLEISTKIEVQVSEVNPYYFLREEQDFQNDPRMSSYLKPIVDISDDLKFWIANQKKTFGDDNITFVSGVNREISQNWKHQLRYQPGILTPDECFHAKEASCRDLCWMLMSILRNQGLPARFVSGYAFNPGMEEGHELHSWVEAWIPGAGWVGFDPVSGLLTNHFYIPTAASYHPKYTLPVQGSFRGKAEVEMNTEVRVTLN